MNLAEVIVKPVLTEKSVKQQAVGVWTFLVKPEATKGQIAEAIKQFFGVEPLKIRVAAVRPKKKFLWRHRRLVQKGRRLKKAWVYLKPGEKIKELEVKEK
jgi:large subunit ribosomal protein L23